MNHLSFHIKLASLFIISLLLPSCARYSFSINDNLIYTPPGLIQVQLADPALSNCVQQHVEDQKITATEQLLQLNCSSAGIVSLAGLDRFSRIESLSLQDNELADVTMLFSLANLQFINLAGNSLIPCEQLTRLKTLTNSTSQFPPECAAEMP